MKTDLGSGVLWNITAEFSGVPAESRSNLTVVQRQHWPLRVFKGIQAFQCRSPWPQVEAEVLSVDEYFKSLEIGGLVAGAAARK